MEDVETRGKTTRRPAARTPAAYAHRHWTLDAGCGHRVPVISESSALVTGAGENRPVCGGL